jgi:stage II sporulation protein AA (anti-sigma F factor antagonist)
VLHRDQLREGCGLLEIHVARHDGRYVIAPLGELDLSTVAAFDRAVHEGEATDARRIVVDLSAVTFMDSSGLKALLEAHARSQADSNRLRLVRGPRRVQRVFELTGSEAELPFLD